METEDTVETVETVETVKTIVPIETEETVETKDLKKYDLPTQLKTDNVKARDASASKNLSRTRSNMKSKVWKWVF